MIQFLLSVETPILVIHFITAVFLMIVILLQTGKGDVGSVFGVGGSSALFGPRGAATLLTKLTTIAAIVFFVTSLSLTAVANEHSKAPKSELDEQFFNSQTKDEETKDEGREDEKTKDEKTEVEATKDDVKQDEKKTEDTASMTETQTDTKAAPKPPQKPGKKKKPN